MEFSFLYRLSESSWKKLEMDTIYLTMTIPNLEIRSIYRTSIREWLTQKIEQTDFSQFYQAVLEENCPAMEAFMKRQLSESISYYDSAENFYHGYLVGVLSGLEGYALDSNKEHGNGRPDILLTPFDPERPAVIMEIKMAERFGQMEKLCELALAQIDERAYALELEAEGYKVIRKYGVCFCKKNCVVRM